MHRGQDEAVRRPTTVSLDHLPEPPEQQTPSIRRRQAFVADDRWVGYVYLTPGEWSAWHHHGGNDTYFYVLRGELEIEWGTDGRTVRSMAGDFTHVPSDLVHRERTPPGKASELILVRIGRGPTVVNVDDPREGGEST